MILDYAHSTLFRSYYGILGTRNGGFSTPSQIAITFVLIIVKVLSCWFYISGTYLSTVISRMMFCRIIGQFGCPRFPEHEELSLFDVISGPIETHVDGA